MQKLKSSVDKTFALLEYFTPQKPEWGVTELATAVGSNKSTVYRFLADLCKLDILCKNPQSDKYQLGLKLFELGSRVSLKSAFVEKTHPELQSVAKDITETVHISVLKNQQVFYVDKVESPQGLKISSQIGSYNPAYATALGKILLAYLPESQQRITTQTILAEGKVKSYTKNTITKSRKLQAELAKIKAQGFAIDREEYELGLICVAVPILNQDGMVIASLSASGPANRFEEKKVTRYVATLKKGADAIQNKIGFFKP